MKAKCAARIQQDRTKTKKRKSKGLFDQSSSDGGDMDHMMDEECDDEGEGEDSMDDPVSCIRTVFGVVQRRESES